MNIVTETANEIYLEYFSEGEPRTKYEFMQIAVLFLPLSESEQNELMHTIDKYDWCFNFLDFRCQVGTYLPYNLKFYEEYKWHTL